MAKTLAGEWAELEQELPPTASSAQRADMRKAFYCGAYSLYSMLMKHLEQGEPGDYEPTEEDLKLMATIDAELVAFRSEMEAEAQRRPPT